MTESRATVARYLRLAIQTDTLPASVALRWADDIVASEPHPTADIIEVAWSRKASDVVMALGGVDGSNELNGDLDFELAERWFLRTLHSQLRAGRAPSDVLRAAKHVLRESSLDFDVYHVALSLENEWLLADSGIHGSTPEVAERIAKFLDGHAAESLPTELEVIQRIIGADE